MRATSQGAESQHTQQSVQIEEYEVCLSACIVQNHNQLSGTDDVSSMLAELVMFASDASPTG